MILLLAFCVILGKVLPASDACFTWVSIGSALKGIHLRSPLTQNILKLILEGLQYPGDLQ